MAIVTIRIWLGAKSKEHISLQVGDFTGNNQTYGVGKDEVYVSIYPERRPALLDNEGLPIQTKTLDQDIAKYKKEGVNEPKIITLSNLDTQAIITEYKNIIKNGFNFSFIASTFHRKPNAYNCACVVLHLLEKGLHQPARKYTWQKILTTSGLSIISSHLTSQALSNIFISSAFRYKILQGDLNGYPVSILEHLPKYGGYIESLLAILSDSLISGAIMWSYSRFTFSTSSLLFKSYNNIIKYDSIIAGAVGSLFFLVKKLIFKSLNISSNAFFVEAIDSIIWLNRLLRTDSNKLYPVSSILKISLLNWRTILILGVFSKIIMDSVSSMLITPRNVLNFIENLPKDYNKINIDIARLKSSNSDFSNNEGFFSGIKNSKAKIGVSIAVGLGSIGIFQYLNTGDRLKNLRHEIFTDKLPAELRKS